jgi:hypothetical protein
MSLTREQIIKVLGDIDDAIVAELIATDATSEELAEAQAWVANDEAFVNDGRPLPSGRVSRLAEILAASDEERNADPAEAGPTGAR